MSSNKIFKLILEVTFDVKKSWLKKHKGTVVLLEHEQRHFDIIELHARIFIKRLEGLEKQSGEKLGATILKIHQKVTKELSRFQIKYDKAPNHSILIEKQKEWTIKIAKLLEKYQKYAKRELILSIK
jgi:predicted secreted Zn-dependent protease